MAKQFSVCNDRRHCAVDRDLMILRSLPRCGNRRSQIGRQGSTLDEFLPGGPYISLVHPDASDMTKSETRGSTDLAINDLNVGCLSQ
jgi:hypothetical protein